MRYAPSQQELDELGTMPGPMRLQYFLTRVMEAEEVWSLADTQGWVMQEVDGKTILPIWPYRQCAETCIREPDLHCHATSLDHFFESILQNLIREDIHLDILPAGDSSGVMLSAVELEAMLRSLMDSGEYFLEG